MADATVRVALLLLDAPELLDGLVRMPIATTVELVVLVHDLAALVPGTAQVRSPLRHVAKASVEPQVVHRVGQLLGPLGHVGRIVPHAGRDECDRPRPTLGGRTQRPGSQRPQQQDVTHTSGR
mgnify:CR=1 FL=1